MIYHYSKLLIIQFEFGIEKYLSNDESSFLTMFHANTLNFLNMKNENHNFVSKLTIYIYVNSHLIILATKRYLIGVLNFHDKIYKNQKENNNSKVFFV